MLAHLCRMFTNAEMKFHFHFCLLSVIFVSFSVEKPQNGFTLTLQNLTYCDRSGSDYISLDNLKIWSNLTTSGYIDIRKDVPAEATISLNIYKVTNQATSRNLFTINRIGVCQMLEQDSLFLPLLRQILNVPQSCPIKKNHWVFKGIQIHKRSSRMALYGCFRCKIKSSWKNKQLSCVELRIKFTHYMKGDELTCDFSKLN